MKFIFKPFYLVAFTPMLLVSCQNQETQKAAPAPVKVTILEVSSSDSPVELSYSGTIEAENTAQIGFAVPGTINHVAVQEGQFVKKGQLLASIDATEYSNALAIANAGLQQAEDLYNRLTELYKKGSLPAKDYIDIQTKVAQAKASKRISAKHIADSKLYAPISGIISAKLVEMGSTAAPGVPAFTIVKTDFVYAKIAVPETEVGNMKMGKTAKVFVPTLNETINGQISIINPQAEASTRAYAVKVKLNNNSQQLLPGMIANVQIAQQKGLQKSISVPASAIVRDADGLTYVFLSNPQQKAIRKRISPGNITGNDAIIIKEGLVDGDKVVIAGQTRLKDGSSLSF
ncbi:efflux RND transporter periplasmic adaptor subunit [Pedobacter gandavensis]|uniref:efflux RND transporter periplasmic adaptor subunit n=1 Tax=Pedobacter gandavensis TaxID=2679963 RepID=UPI002930864E|nr:efflux RND transporter periplasmic adaptor subunit [Pedobacter gandavensis]